MFMPFVVSVFPSFLIFACNFFPLLSFIRRSANEMEVAKQRDRERERESEGDEDGKREETCKRARQPLCFCFYFVVNRIILHFASQ